MKNNESRLRKWAIIGILINIALSIGWLRVYILKSLNLGYSLGDIAFWIVILITLDLITIIPTILYIKKSFNNK